MDHPDGVANLNGKPVFDARVFDRLVGGSIWPSILFLGAFLHIGCFICHPLHTKADC